MDLSTVVTKIDTHQYLTAKDFLVDIDLICNNALEYNPDKDPGGEEENELSLIKIHKCTYVQSTVKCFFFILPLFTDPSTFVLKYRNSNKRFLKKPVFLKNTQNSSKFKSLTFMLKMVDKCGKSLILSFFSFFFLNCTILLTRFGCMKIIVYHPKWKSHICLSRWRWVLCMNGGRDLKWYSTRENAVRLFNKEE